MKSIYYLKISKEGLALEDKPERVRVNITMADEMVEFYQGMADEMGIPRSTAMVMALKTYMDQQKIVKMQYYLEKSEKAER